MSYSAYDSPYSISGFGMQDQDQHVTKSQDQLRKRKEEGLQKVKTFGFIQLCLSIVLFGCGLATIILASENIGFPIFNPGPLITSIVIFIAGCFGFFAGRKGLENLRHGDVDSTTNCMVKANFGLSIALLSIAGISGVLAFISGAICAGANITFTDRNTGKLIDPAPYCDPNKNTLAGLAFAEGVLCILVMIWAILGLCMFCAYGRAFGIQQRRRRI